MLPFALTSTDSPGPPDDEDLSTERPPESPLESPPLPPDLSDATPFRDPSPESSESPEPEEPSAPAIPPPEPADLRPSAPPEPPPAPAPPKRSRVQRLIIALLLIGAAGLIGYMLSRPSETPEAPSVLSRSIEAAGTLRLVRSTDQPAEAQQFVRDEFGWRVGVPTFTTATLRGVALARAAPAVEVPVFLYTDAEGRDVAVFAYSYALLDQVPDRLTLARSDYDDLDLGTPIIRQSDNTEVLLWRDRDDIYVAVTDLPPHALQDGLSMER